MANDRWSGLKWVLGIASGAVIGAVSVRLFDKYLGQKLAAQEKKDFREIEAERRDYGPQAQPQIAANPLMHPVYTQMLSPVIPALPTFTPTIAPPPIYPAAPRYSNRRVATNEEVDEEDDELAEIQRSYMDLDS